MSTDRTARAVIALAFALAAACGGSNGGDGGTPTPNEFTLHYYRADAAYAGWTVATTTGAVEASASASGTDGWGAVYRLTLAAGATELAFSLANGGTPDPAGSLTVDVSGDTRVAYVISGFPEAIPREPPAVPAANQVALYYKRPDGNYAGWGLHTWGELVNETAWTTPVPQKGVDPTLGAGFVVDLAPNARPTNCPDGIVCFILHAGDTKNHPEDVTSWNPDTVGRIVFVEVNSKVVHPAPPVGPPALEIQDAAAHLVSPTLVVWNVAQAAATAFELRYSATAEVASDGADVVGGSTLTLTPRATPLPPAIAARVPHLNPNSGWRAFDVAAGEAAEIEDALRGQLVAVARGADGKALAATQVQAPFAIDDLWFHDGPLGPSWSGGAPTVALWAPTAQAVTLEVYEPTDAKAVLASVELARGEDGVWSHTGPAAWNGAYYRFVVRAYHWTSGQVETMTVTDPYSVSLSTDSQYSQFVDLSDPTLAPEGWDTLAKPPLAAPEDVVVYEVHIRDFSANDATVPAERRGKYLGFVTPPGGVPSDGLAYLASLRAAGLTHVHLLPAFDVATIPEDAEATVDLDDGFADLCARNPAVPVATCGQHAGRTVREVMESLPGDSEQQQQIAAWMRTLDSFNWGYDPLHYGVPEGSYASDPEGTTRILEFRRMVKGLAELGLRTVLDVVYNHTNASGLSPRSVLDKAVPGYYHRRNPQTGAVEKSTCCENTATEHRMMQKLMIDTLVRWARDYRIDAFRFDLMGHHMKQDMLDAQAALHAIDPSIYLYGEGWNFGEVANGARGSNATQINMGGTGIGTFNDRLRDGVRGGGPFDDGDDLRRRQGFASGGVTEPNEVAGAPTPATTAAFLASIDWIKAGMAGNLAEFRLLAADGVAKTAFELDYNGQRAGYTQDPQEVINYVSKHDNQTLFDIFQYKLDREVTMADRVRMQNVALATVLLGQGVPFFHMADERLRSKSMERDSFDSGDWFNRVDWTGEDTGWRSGLPNAEKDGPKWPRILSWAFSNPLIDPTPSDVAAGAAHFRELLSIRKSSPLFRLRSEADVMKRVDFQNAGPAQVPGLIVMTLTDGACGAENLPDLDPARDAIVVIVNADRVARTVTVPGAAGFTLHPTLAASDDLVVRGATATGADFTVPARTAAVFEQVQGAARGAGLPCNAR